MRIKLPPPEFSVALAIAALLFAVPFHAVTLYQIRTTRLELARIAEADARVAREDLALPDVFGWREFCAAELAWNETAAAAYRRGAGRPWTPIVLPPEPEYAPPP